MELDDLKQHWDDHDRKLEGALRLNTGLLRTSALGKAASALRRLSWLLKLDLVIDALALLWIGSFLGDHLTEPRFLIPAAVLHLFVIVNVFAGVHQLIALAGIDYGAPVVEIQKRLGVLRVQRLRVMKLTFLLCPLLWTPLLIVGLKSLLGLDAYALFPTRYVVGNWLFGLAVIPLAVWIARRFAGRMERSPLLRSVLRDLAGYNLNAATDFLGSLQRFEREEPAR
jgi:serine/threonine-protein kinase